MVKHPYTNAMKYRALANKSKSKILELKNKHLGNSVLILGTGPSLNDIDFNKVKVDSVIYLNNAISIKGLLRAKNEYLVITDFLRTVELRPQLVSEPNVSVFCSSDKIFNPNIDSQIFEDPFIFLNPKVSYATSSQSVSMSVTPSSLFSDDLIDGVYLGKSVVFPAIQIASYLGYERIYLAGVDMNPNEKIYFDKKVKGNWSGFNYETDGREHMKNIAQHLIVQNKRIFTLGSKGINHELPRLPVGVVYE